MLENFSEKKLNLENWTDFENFKMRVLLGESFEGWLISLDFAIDFAIVDKFVSGLDSSYTFGGSFVQNSSADHHSAGIDRAVVMVESPNASLTNNGVSQIIGFDEKRRAVGYIANEGVEAPIWKGIWDWNDNSGMRAVATGHFAGASVEHDGVLCYNEKTFTFDAWTDITDSSYGYVSLGNAGSAVEVKDLAKLDGNDFDDVLVVKKDGSIGVMLDVKNYKAITTGNAVELAGAGTFKASGLDSLVVKENGAYWLWSTSDINSGSWTKTKIMNVSNQKLLDITGTWEVAAIGDFKNDGIDDIIMTDKNGYSFLLNDGKASSVEWSGLISRDFEVSGVGDYNGDGREDLLLREMTSGWGGLGYWNGGDSGVWIDLNARIETTDSPGHSGIFSVVSKVSR